MGLGAVWLGEILKNKDKILEILKGSKELELMSVTALGRSADKGGKGNRGELGKSIFFRK